ncbi:MAG TPA: hypothetical protein VLW26_00150 [Steroidobacteraceae bacterium]|nr:hypothetical protein [Steroidobacteraceae bacterium]
MKYLSRLLPLALLFSAGAEAQFVRGPPPAPPNAHIGAPMDVTGYWVAIVTEDWRYRMMTPDKGDAAGIALNPKGRALAASWDPARDEAAGEQCKSYGAPAIMRIPTRLHIVWKDDDTLQLDTDAGRQTRLFHFRGAAAEGGAPSRQGYSKASWEGMSRATVAWDARRGEKPKQQGYLRVITTQLQPGYLRKNGIPYGASASVEEFIESFTEPNGDTWLVVTSIVRDPEYLNDEYITSSQFKKLAGPSGWRPSDCEAR